MKRIACLVTNDLSHDQRMNRICSALSEAGYEVTLIGRRRQISAKLPQRPYRQKRLPCFFRKTALFYAEFNIRLFFHLLRNNYDIINANDLDTILPALWAARLKGAKVVYDAHEYFTEQEEVVNRKFVKKIWKAIERYSVPKTDARYTVSNGYKKLFEDEYGLSFGIVRNVTRLLPPGTPFKSGAPYILYQGAVNHGRALEESILAMKSIAGMKLVICGLGDIYDRLKNMVAGEGLEDVVELKGFVEPDRLRSVTAGASIGLTLFDRQGLSHWYSLANRFFDYMHAGIPQIAMNYPEYRKVNEQFEVAVLIDDIRPETIAEAANRLLSDKALYERLATNAVKAREVYNWQQNEKDLLDVYERL